jgi:hypothetical protein
MFASFSDTLNQDFAYALFSVVTLIMFAKQFAAKNPRPRRRPAASRQRPGSASPSGS